jgi:UDP-glucose 4-epimerase
VREVIDTVERVTGAACRGRSRRAGRRSGGALRRAAEGAAELHWTPRFADLETIVRTAWDWHRTHPQGMTEVGARQAA